MDLARLQSENQKFHKAYRKEVDENDAVWKAKLEKLRQEKRALESKVDSYEIAELLREGTGGAGNTSLGDTLSMDTPGRAPIHGPSTLVRDQSRGRSLKCGDSPRPARPGVETPARAHTLIESNVINGTDRTDRGLVSPDPVDRTDPADISMDNIQPTDGTDTGDVPSDAPVSLGTTIRAGNQSQSADIPSAISSPDRSEGGVLLFGNADREQHTDLVESIEDDEKKMDPTPDVET